MSRGIACRFSLATLLLAGSALARPPCREVSDIVGYERCTSYGAGWSIERTFPFRVDGGLDYLALDPRGRTFKGSFGAGEPGSFRYSGDSVRGPLVALMLEVRPSILIISGLYAGFEFGAGAGHGNLPRVTTADGWQVDASATGANVFFANAGAAAGYRIPAGRLAIRFEAMAGLRIATAYQGAVSGASPSPRQASVTLATGVIEPRLALDVWLSPSMTVSAFAGVNVLGLGDRSFGLAFGFHKRTFDGAR